MNLHPVNPSGDEPDIDDDFEDDEELEPDDDDLDDEQEDEDEEDDLIDDEDDEDDEDLD